MESHETYFQLPRDRYFSVPDLDDAQYGFEGEAYPSGSGLEQLDSNLHLSLAWPDLRPLPWLAEDPFYPVLNAPDISTSFGMTGQPASYASDLTSASYSVPEDAFQDLVHYDHSNRVHDHSIHSAVQSQEHETRQLVLDTPAAQSFNLIRAAPRKNIRKKSQRGCAKSNANGPSRAKLARSKSVAHQAACWRCRRYKKQCDSADVCEACLTSGFRVWPSTLGCIRGNLDFYTTILLPANAGEILQAPAGQTLRHPRWRTPISLEECQILSRKHIDTHKWTMLSNKVIAAQLFGTEFDELLNILVRYQQSQPTENTLLDAACVYLDASCDFYHHVVESTWNIPEPDLHEAISRFHSASNRAFRLLLQTCISARREQWFPCILAVSLVVVSIVLMMDAAFSLPIEQSRLLWADLRTTCANLREPLYQTVLDLLNVNSGSANPLTMKCWSVDIIDGEENTSSNVSPTIVRNAEGMRLLNHDVAAFDGFTALQSWLRINQPTLELGKMVFANTPYTVSQISPIVSLHKVFCT